MKHFGHKKQGHFGKAESVYPGIKPEPTEKELVKEAVIDAGLSAIEGKPIKISSAEIDKVRSYRVSKSNYLIQKSRYNLTLQEQRILNFVIAHIKPKDDDPYQYFDFDLVSFCGVCGIDSSNTTHLRRIIKKLYDRPSIEIFDGEKYAPYKWLGDYEIIPKKRKLRLQLHHRLGEFLFLLKNNFTSSELCLCLLFNNTNSFHIYELLKSMMGQERTDNFVYRISVEDLKYKLMLENKYKNFNDFNRFILQPTLKEINNIADVKVGVEWEYTGKQVTSLIFSVETIYAIEWKRRKKNFMLMIDNKRNEAIKHLFLDEKGWKFLAIYDDLD